MAFNNGASGLSVRNMLNASLDKTDLITVTGSVNLDLDFAPVSHTHSIANVTGLQTALDAKVDLTGLDELVDDRVDGLLVAGRGIGLTYNDGSNTLNIDNTVFDRVSANTSQTVDDTNDLQLLAGSSSGAVVYTLSATASNGTQVRVVGKGTGTFTLTPASGATINGSASSVVLTNGRLYDLAVAFNSGGSAAEWYLHETGGGGGVTDHGALSGLGDDDHTQYLLVDGTRNPTGKLTYSIAPTITAGNDIPNKTYVDSVVGTVSDGDYGAIVVSLSGSVWTIADGAVSISKIASSATSGLDSTLISGTAGADGQIGVFNADGDLVGLAGNDVSAFGGLIGISGGATVDVDTKAELNARITDLNSVADEIYAPNAQTGTSYTLALTDRVVTMDNASANTLTIPTNASVAFPTGSPLLVYMIGAGTTTIQGATGVTVNGTSGGSVDIQNQYQAAGLYKIGTDTWIVSGDIA